MQKSGRALCVGSRGLQRVGPAGLVHVLHLSLLLTAVKGSKRKRMAPAVPARCRTLVAGLHVLGWGVEMDVAVAWCV